MLVVRKTTETKKKLTVSQPTLLKGEGEAQFNSHIGGLIIFVKDCRLSEKRGHGHADMENANMENADIETADMENADKKNADKHIEILVWSK